LVARLRHRVSEREVICAGLHLYWDPHYPHTKVSQAEMACRAVRAFAGEQGIPHAPVILVGDLNSVPHMQPGFLPDATRDSIPARGYLPPDTEECLAASGVYQLLHRGELPSYHPEHPDTFGKPVVVVVPDIPADIVVSAPTKGKKKKTEAGAGSLYSGLDLQSAYETVRGGRPIPFSTKCADFCGALDYILSTLPRSAVLSVLALPYTDDEAHAFPCIPNAEFPSDHLALGDPPPLGPSPPPLPSLPAPTSPPSARAPLKSLSYTCYAPQVQCMPSQSRYRLRG
jgi:hypothetical protein